MFARKASALNFKTILIWFLTLLNSTIAGFISCADKWLKKLKTLDIDRIQT